MKNFKLKQSLLFLLLFIVLGIITIFVVTKTVKVQTSVNSEAAVNSPSFSFITWADGHNGGTKLSTTSNQVSTLNPNFTIFAGDLQNNGFNTAEMNSAMSSLNGGASNNGISDKTFAVRGNHDDNGDAPSWQNYFVNLYSATRPLPQGVTNYVGIDSSSSYLIYSFDYGNSRFIGLDTTGSVEYLKTPQYNFLDARLKDATSKGLTHAFIYFHGPIYCVESSHCKCPSANDSSCTPSALVTIFNKYPIVSATFHGHEHILGWTHMSKARLSGLTNEYEQFVTSPAGSTTYNKYLSGYGARTDYVNLADTMGFGAVNVVGNSFTVSLYRTGTSAPVWTKTFTKSGGTSTPLPSNPADINNDGIVNIVDIGIVVDNYNQNPILNLKADVNSDGVVNMVDIGILIDNYN